MKISITLKNGERSFVKNCDNFTLAIHFPGERGTQESTPEMLATYLVPRSLRYLQKLYADEGKDAWINRKIRGALAIQLWEERHA